LPTAKDYKRIGEGDTGLNTGGMGAVSPVPYVDAVLMKKIETRIVKPTIEGFQKDGIEYKGFVFIGLINVNNEPIVIEYNVRMGDPETEVVVPRMKSDLVELFLAVANEKLDEFELEIDPRSATTVVLVSGGYPEEFEKGKLISGLESIEGSIVFHAGSKLENGKVLSNGGRVLTVTSFGEDFEQALKKSYQNIDNIHFDKMYFRKDIGNDLK
jgi:phosphoribosylamine--glycine ligase